MNGSSEICTSCAACCDGTLFSFGKLELDEEPPRISEAGTTIISRSNAPGFPMPCAALENRCCQIYHLVRPSVCSRYRCLTLKSYESRQITLETALARVRRLKELTQIFRKEASLFTTNAERMPIHELARILPDDKRLREDSGLLKIWSKAKLLFVALNDYQVRFFVGANKAKSNDKQSEPVCEATD